MTLDIPVKTAPIYEAIEAGLRRVRIELLRLRGAA